MHEVHPAELAALDSLNKVRWALGHATHYASLAVGDAIPLFAAIAQYTPDNTAKADLFSKIAGEHPANMQRVDALHDLSLADAPFAEAAWEQALAASVSDRMNKLGYGSDKQSALEIIVAGQSDPTRLLQAKEAAGHKKPYVQARVLRAIAAQEAANGNLSEAYNTRSKIQAIGYPAQAHEATIGIVAAHAQSGQSLKAMTVAAGLPDHLQPWAYLGIHRHFSQNACDKDTVIEAGLRQHWSRYTFSQRQAITADLLAAGKDDVAHELLLRPAVSERQAARAERRDAIIALAHHQAATDRTEAHTILAELEAEMHRELAVATAEGIDIPFDTPDHPSPEGITNQQEQDYLRASLNIIAMHRTALLVRDDPELALAQYEQAMFWDDKQGVYRQAAQGLVAAALAQNNHTTEAATLAATIKENVYTYTLKAGAFLAIAQALR